MKTRIYTDEEIKTLKQNMFVRDVLRKREICYDPLFKLWTIMMRLEFPELSAREIFARGGFDVSALHKKLPQRRIKDWLDNYKQFGVKYFLPENESYSTIRKVENNLLLEDSMRNQLMRIVLNKLKEYENGNR